MKKVTIYGSYRNGGDGSVGMAWFLEWHQAVQDQENMEEGWGEPCIEEVETFEGSNIHQRAVKNSAECKHEYLKREDYYENRPVGTGGRKDKWCSHCGGPIDKGIPHDVHHFYPEFTAYPTHTECTEAFKKSLN
jgi:hypothetical protein